MEPCKEAISVRVRRLNQQLLNKPQNVKEKTNLLAREGLLDCLQLLYDECNSDCVKANDKLISQFVDKHRKTLIELRQLRVNLSDFEVKNVIGRGHFGDVHVVKEKQTGDVYAMKTVRKYENIEHKCASYEEERNIMALAKSPWITVLQYAFQDSTSLYFIMEYHPGGDLLGLLYRQGGTLPESAATFYIAELVVAINDLHAMGYVHRDIKPDNILLDRCGHLKLADFGSAAKLNPKGIIVSGGIPVGTPDYIAPEALQSLDNKAKQSGTYGKPCDYWSLGILAYELTIGVTPFTAQNTTATYSKIMNYAKALKFPPDVLLTQAYITFIKSLLADQAIRLNYEQIIKENLFTNCDFNTLRDQVPPYVPKILSIDDTSNFSDIQTKKRVPNIENYKSKTQFSGKNLPFVGFTYTTEPNDYKEPYRQSLVLKDENVEKLKKEIDALQRKLRKNDDISVEKDGIEKKLEERGRKMESLENLRDRLERDLANNIAESQALKRTLDLERKDRCDLERKALDLIKSAKLKWETAEKIKMDNISTELDECKEKNSKLSEEINKLNEQLQKTMQLSDKHKASMENVQKWRRGSVMGLESRLSQVTTETQTKISSLQTQLSGEMQKKSDLEKRIMELENEQVSLKNKLDFTEKECTDWKTKCSKSDVVIKAIKDDLDRRVEDAEKYKELVGLLEVQIRDLKSMNEDKITLEDNFRNEVDASMVLKKQIKDLKTELNSLRAAKLSSIDDTNKRNQNTIKDLEEQIKKVSEEKSELIVKYQEAQLSLENKESKARTLEDLLNRLQTDLSKLENGSERESVLQEQIERLEQQLVEVGENAALEKQELSQMKSKYWRIEKKLGNAELDKKIVERDLKEHQTKSIEMTKEIERLNEKLDNRKKSSEDAVMELNNLNENLFEDILKLKNNIQDLERQLNDEKIKGNESKQLECELRHEIELKEFKVCAVLKTLDQVKCEKNVLEHEIKEIKNEKRTVNAQFDEIMKANMQLQNDLDKSKRELENSHLNRKALREACTILESQLVEFENLFDSSESKRQTLEKELNNLSIELTTYKNSVQSAKKIANEEKSMKLLAETKCKRLKDDIEALTKELLSYKEESIEFKAYSNNLSEELTDAEQKLTNYQIAVKNYERQIENFVTESNYFKEENSEQLTVIHNVKEINYNLGQSLNDYKARTNALVEKIHELDVILNEKSNFYRERELKAEATMRQQTKLIDFLQSKVEEIGKKKKTFADKLFGHSKKENQPPISVALNYKDLETQLNKEKEENKTLHQEIIKLKAELYAKGESDYKLDAMKNLHLQDDILSQIVQSPTSQKNDLYRQNSVQRMHHNIPHRFETKLCAKVMKCVQCLNKIVLGSHYSICKECHLTTHTNCAQSLPRTCGLPSGFAKHYSETLTKCENSKVVTNQKHFEHINIEGWIKIPVVNSGWEKHYACLMATTFNIYREPPNNPSIKPIQSIELDPQNEHGKVILEPIQSEIGVPVANSDLPFVIKVETSPNSTCWPSECVIFMTLSMEDKEKWFKGLQNIFQGADKFAGEVIQENIDDLEINALVELNKTTKLLGTETGLFSLHNNKTVHISGPLQVFEIITIESINLVLMIVDECRILIQCDLKHVLSLSQCAQCTKPTLQFKVCNVNNLDNFHIMKASDFGGKKNICVATPKQLIILKWDFTQREFFPVRILDTAEPVSCILFTPHSLLIGVDKFFEVDLDTFEADEFLDASDLKLSHAVQCYKLRSFPLAILQITKRPTTEYLCCFNEFAIFVDEYGRSTRSMDVKWTHLPKDFFYKEPYLYIVQFNAIEIYKITPTTCNSQNGGDESMEVTRVDLSNPQYLGSNKKGIFVRSNSEIRYFNASVMDDDASSQNSSQISQSTEDVLDHSDRFSFTSSIVQSLDGNLSEYESEVTENNVYVNQYTNKKVKFVTSTDL